MVRLASVFEYSAQGFGYCSQYSSGLTYCEPEIILFPLLSPSPKQQKLIDGQGLANYKMKSGLDYIRISVQHS